MIALLYVIIGVVLIAAALIFIASFKVSKISHEGCGEDPGSCLKNILWANQKFKEKQYGESDVFQEKYSGYSKQTSDFLKVKDIRNVISDICAKEGEDGHLGEYYYRYTVLKKSKNKDGKMAIDSFMVCAWPEFMGRVKNNFVSKVFITKEDGKIYRRDSDANISVPITKWPDDETLKKEWEEQPK